MSLGRFTTQHIQTMHALATGTQHGYKWNQHVQGWTGSAHPRGIGFWGPQNLTKGTVEIAGVPGGNYTLLFNKF